MLDYKKELYGFKDYKREAYKRYRRGDLPDFGAYRVQDDGRYETHKRYERTNRIIKAQVERERLRDEVIKRDLVCNRRKARREALFKSGAAGAGRKVKDIRKYTEDSDIRCK